MRGSGGGDKPALRVAAICWHDVTDDPASSGFQRARASRYKLTREEFGAHLDAISAVAIMPSLVSRMAEETGDRRLFLTFDDGGASAMWVAGKLEQLGWRGHFFVTTAMIGKPSFLDEGRIRELVTRGHVVGSHSHTHPRLCWGLTEDQMLEEWRRSRSVLEHATGHAILSASVPGGNMNRGTARAAARAGFRWLFTSEVSLSPWREGALTCFGRVLASRTTTPAQAARWASFRGYGSEAALRLCKQGVKRVLGPLWGRVLGRDSTA